MAYGVPRAAAVVAVDVQQPVVRRRTSRAGRRITVGHPGPPGERGQRVVVVQREEQRAVHVAAGQIAADPLVVAAPSVSSSTNWLSCAVSSLLMPRTCWAKKGSAKNRVSGSATTTAMASVAPGDQGAGGLVGT